MKNILSSFPPFINRNSNFQADNIEFKKNLFHFEPLNINTQLIKQIRIKKERTLSPNPIQNPHALILSKINVQKQALKKVKLKSSIDYRALQELDFNAQLQFLQPTSFIHASTNRSHMKDINLLRRQKCRDKVQFCNQKIETERKIQSKFCLCLPKLHNSLDINQSRDSLNSWTMNSTFGLFQVIS
ncbi:unnamed protein product (macronuclear) [Paramecium tetraurelia]|uniref:Uncharacterized protein n=1 Tax=Paramecium tetraurelia TaxID=5888 RepID=A0C7Y8_PARTE|nr:uncharacterized protein GSPATT00036036001 [Paramecium tetraurelia]CAK66905.1 unnamed protein product [Paramecium tetraurelia]|eukprot:XP_001434302.1 hypothetical protein (macronuclear) [Paramecium tetraurelia strain d4-2]